MLSKWDINSDDISTLPINIIKNEPKTYLEILYSYFKIE